MSKSKENEGEFYAGIICALAVVNGYDNPVISESIVKTVDEKKLMFYAKEHDSLEWAGLHKLNIRSNYPSKCSVSDFHCSYPECSCGR